jgi:peptide/nickel transport system permease protein
MAIPVVFAIMAVTFVLARSIPGDPCRAILGEKASVETCERFTVEHGLDKPIAVQFGIYLQNLARGDLGDSIRFGRPVLLIMIERLPTTIELGFSAMIIAIFVGVPLGIIAAVKRNSPIDVGVMIGANLGVSLPVFFLGLILIYVFAVMLRDTPFALPPSGRIPAGMVNVPFYEIYNIPVEEGTARFYVLEFFANLYIPNSIITGQWDALWGSMRHLILPAVALSTIPLAIIARITRSSMLEVLGLDYVRTARAKGVPSNRVISKHAFRNALLPVVTIVGLQLGAILGGAVLTETIFGFAGVGLSVYEAITARDFPIIQGFVIIIAVVYVTFNLIVDLSYGFLDPRIRLD